MLAIITHHRKKRFFIAFAHFLFVLFLTSLIFSFRAVTSISIMAILIAGIFRSKLIQVIFEKKSTNLFLGGCLLFFLLQVSSLLYTADIQQGLNNIRIKTGILITPLAICLFSCLYMDNRKKLWLHYCLILTIATLYCLFNAFFNFLETGNTSLFFYHTLAGPINQHAVYLSLLVAIALIFLLEDMAKKELSFAQPWYVCLVIYLSVFLFLLSSKLVIAFYFFYLVYYFFTGWKKERLTRRVMVAIAILCIAIASLALTIRNPVSARFYEIIETDIQVIRQEKFNPGDYFNGLQFRLLQWRLVGEILSEKKCWLTGVAPGDAQTELNNKYISKNMYSGDPARGDRGYLIYNTHNQFLETLLQNGIIGLSVFLIICFSLVQMAVQKKNRVLSFIVLLVLAWSFTESVFETQYGIIIFTFFPLFVAARKTEKPIL